MSAQPTERIKLLATMAATLDAGELAGGHAVSYIDAVNHARTILAEVEAREFINGEPEEPGQAQPTDAELRTLVATNEIRDYDGRMCVASDAIGALKWHRDHGPAALAALRAGGSDD